MLRPHFEITINDIVIKNIGYLEVVSSWDTYTDTAKLMFPIKFNKDGVTITTKVESLFKRGDFVTIKSGYFPDLTTIFQGYITKINPDSPIEIEMEDEAHLLKQKNVSFSYDEVSLSNLIQEIVGNTVSYEVVQDKNNPTLLGKVKTVGRPNVIQALDKLRKIYGIVSYVRDRVLQVGLEYYPATSRTIDIAYEKQVITSSKLEYMKDDDTKVVLRGQNRNKDNTVSELWAYYENGQIQVSELRQEGDVQKSLITLNYSKKKLEETLRAELPKYIYSGYRGSITTFGQPIIKHGDTIALTSTKFPERNSRYKVDKVVTRFTPSNGYKQIVTLGIKVST